MIYPNLRVAQRVVTKHQTKNINSGDELYLNGINFLSFLNSLDDKEWHEFIISIICYDNNFKSKLHDSFDYSCFFPIIEFGHTGESIISYYSNFFDRMSEKSVLMLCKALIRI